MKNIVNIGFQILPVTSHENVYQVVDNAIEVIRQSGITYEVCPFETVMEGTFAEIMTVIEQAIEAAYKSGATDVISHIRIHSRNNADVQVSEKMDKYR